MLRTLLARHSTRLRVAGSNNGIKCNLHKYRAFSTTGVDLVRALELADLSLFWKKKEWLKVFTLQEKLRVAIIGQSQFAAEVYKQVRSSGHDVVGVFTVPDVGGREDPVAETAKKDGVKARVTSYPLKF